MKNKILAITFTGFLIIMFLINILKSDVELSVSERRKLAQFPEISLDNLLNGKVMREFDKYVDDQFVARDEFRNIKSIFQYNILHLLDNNEIFIKDNNIFKMEYKTNKKAIGNFVQKINNTQKMFSKDNTVYYAVIPDKNYYLEDNFFLKMNYDYLYQEVKKISGNYIELRDILSLEDFYETDTHWRQERLEKVVQRLGEKMNFENNTSYYINEYDNFYGVLYGQSARPRESEKLYYLSNDTINNAHVKYLENKNENRVYIPNNLSSIDSYNTFLDGASSFIEIINYKSNQKKELVIFRDSFASSLTPLLIESYSKITLIDMRYITKENYESLITFTDQDVLFLYSTALVNNSSILK